MSHFSRFVRAWLGSPGAAPAVQPDKTHKHSNLTLISVMLGIILVCGCQQEASQQTAELSDAALYQRHCAACHGGMGEGLGRAVPPLNGSEWLQLSGDDFVQLLLRGIQGSIRVKGVEYRSQMPAQSHLPDERLQRIANFVRQQWGADAALITLEQVTAGRVQARTQGPLRAEVMLERLPER